MVLRKVDYNEKCLNSLSNSYSRIEKIIDDKLLSNIKTIHVKELPSEFREELVKLIISQYKNAGWNVNRIQGYDQRDHDSWDYLTFS